METTASKFKAQFEILTRLFDCKHCERKYPSKESLKRHNISIHGPKPVPCKECDQKFIWQTKLDEHVKRKHLKSRDVKCYVCDKGFVNKTDLNTHQNSVHSEERPFKCDECDSCFKRVSTLYSHKRMTHSSLKPFECPVCKKSFKSKGSSVKCVEKHSLGGTQYACHVKGCTKTLTTMEGIRLHVKVSHTDNLEKHKCETCSKDFSNSGDMKRHIKYIHIKPEKKFQCNTCPTKCHTKGQLERHFAIHQGQTFNCSYPDCTTKRSTQYDLNHHMKKKHGKVKHKKDYIPVEERPQIECEKCGQKLKSGASPLHTLKLHMEVHAKERLERCPFRSCTFEVVDRDPKYYHTKAFYTHMFDIHSTSDLKVSYKCKICDKELSPKQNNKTPPQKTFKDSLINHMFTHEEADFKKNYLFVTNRYKSDKFTKDWSKFYERITKIENDSEKEHASRLDQLKQDLSIEEYQRAFEDIMRRTPVVNICKIEI